MIMRLIDADEIMIKPDFILYGVCGTPVIRCEDLARIINDMPTIEPHKWIPCSEELPKNGTAVLFCDDEGDIYNGYCLVKDGGRYHRWKEYHNADRIKNVVAWMHWPEPWKEKEE